MARSSSRDHRDVCGHFLARLHADVLDFAILHEDVAAFVDGKSRRKLVPVFRDERADAGVAASLFIGRRQEDYVAVQMCIGPLQVNEHRQICG